MARRAVAFALFIASMAACASHDDAPAGPPKPWHVSGGAIRDAAGRSVVLRGVNLAGSQKMPPHIASFTRDDYARVSAEWGFDVIRFILTWAAIEPTKGAYDEAYLDAVEERMRWARDAGLLVVLDMHQDLYGEGFAGGDGAPRWTCDESRYAAFVPKDPWFFGYLDPNLRACVDAFYDPAGEPRAHFIDAWKKLATRLRAYDNVIGFDILNEPSWGSYSILAFEADKLTPFYGDVANAVRAIAPSWLVFAEPSGSRNIGYPTSLTKLAVDDVVYAPHSYDNDAEQGKGFDPSRRDAIFSNAAALRAEADALGSALFIGEYGAQTDKPGLEPYMRAEIDAAGSVGTGGAYWSYDKGDGGYAMLRADGSEKPELMNQIVMPYPTRVAGAVSSYVFDPTTRVATIRWVPDASVTAPTEIAIPPRVYPKGYDVDCGGCASAPAPENAAVLRITSAPPGNPAVVVLRPRG